MDDYHTHDGSMVLVTWDGRIIQSWTCRNGERTKVHDGQILCQLKGTACCITHRIHGAAIYGNMDPINIPPMLAYIPYMDPMGNTLHKNCGEVMLNPPRYNMGVQNIAK